MYELAFAVTAYRIDHGKYPVRLTAVVPKYLAKLPKDRFNNDADFQYTSQGNQCLLYSVGLNGVDDGGKGSEDREKEEHGGDWDDISIRLEMRHP